MVFKYIVFISRVGYLLGIPSKKLEAIIYYERYVVINAGAAAEQRCDSFLWNEWGASDGEGEGLEGFVF